MEYKRFGEKIVVRLNPGEEVAECIREVCRNEKVALGEVSGLGAACEVELGVFDTGEKKDYGKSFKGIYEIASLTGNITQQGGNPYLHLHMVIGNPLEGECHGGHLNRAVISATAEIFITVLDGTAGRRMSESIGLNLIEFAEV